MEFDVLKKQLEESAPHYSRNEIESIFEIRAKRTVSDFNKVMQIDLIVMAVVALLMVALTFALGLKEKYFISLEILLIAGLLYVHFRIKKAVIQRQLANTGIILSIEKVISRIRCYVTVYKVLIPVIICSVYAKTILILLNSRALINDTTWYLLSIVIPLAYLSYKFTKWLIKQLYQPTITRLIILKNQLSESFK